MHVFVCEEHTDVNDPLLGCRLTCVPVIPKAELHFWAFVVVKHSHHNSLKWRKEGDRKQCYSFTCLEISFYIHLSLRIPLFSHIVISCLQ